MQMSDLIFRSDALKALSNGEGCSNICSRAIRHIPAVDAMPVVRAKWEIDYSWLNHCRCSNCHGTSIEAEWLNRYMWPYCPNCGAKMDGGESGETDRR